MNNGTRPYQTVVPLELDEKIQAQALKRHFQGKLKDQTGEIVELRVGPQGPRISRYLICRIALEEFANGERK